MNKPTKPTKPFFARFLDEQETETATGGCGGGPIFTTKKFPSDSDEAGSDAVYTTMKFPSDSDEAGGEI